MKKMRKAVNRDSISANVLGEDGVGRGKGKGKGNLSPEKFPFPSPHFFLTTGLVLKLGHALAAREEQDQ